MTTTTVVVKNPIIRLSSMGTSNRVVVQPTIIRISRTGLTNVVVVKNKQIEILTARGIRGTPGDEPVPYAKQIDFESSGSIIYIGEAVPGGLTSNPIWRIKKITFVNVECDTTVEWSNGTSNFTSIWNDRLSLTYS